MAASGYLGDYHTRSDTLLLGDLFKSKCLEIFNPLMPGSNKKVTHT